jgi:NAD(P)-dependent dehydrogenase (short-subunit alcohol dehydrogenase family)
MKNRMVNPMKIDFGNQVALVTGAGSGFGRATAELLAKCGATVVALDRNADRLASVPGVLAKDRGQQHHTIVRDLRPVSVARTIGSEVATMMGRLDIVVNSAGVCHFNRINEITEDEWDEVFDVDLRSLHYVSVGAAETMDGERGGRIINIGSSAGRRGRPMSAHYAAAKAAVINLTESLALAYAARKITVNAVCPAPVMTDLWTTGFSELNRITGKSPEQLQQAWTDLTPLKRLGSVEDIANMIVFLASEKASFVTGQAINVCGGFTLMA